MPEDDNANVDDEYVLSTFMMSRCEMIAEDDSNINNNQEQWRVSSARGDPNNAHTHAKHSHVERNATKSSEFFKIN